MEPKKIITTAFTLLAFVVAFAQGSDDAQLYSQTYYQGTAKAMGMGNALGAVGGDMTAVNINPASLGIYRSNELAMTVGLHDNYQSSTYYNTQNGANRIGLSIPNVSYVNAKERSNYRALRFTQFGIGLTRTNDYNIHTYAKGINPTSSKIDSYLNTINELGLTEYDLQDYAFDLYPAWSTYLIDLYQDEQGTFFGSPVPQGDVWQGMETDFKGRSEEWTFSGSANYAERLFIGISANLAHIKREGTKVFEESMPIDSDIDTDFSRWTYSESLNSVGWGGSLKVGLIFHANRWLRIGAAFHSPTLYNFDESWQTETEAEYGNNLYKYISPESHYEYTFIKPLKWVGSMAFVIGQRGIISFDAEYINYASARFNAEDYDYDNVNDDIKTSFCKTFNFRFGTEWHVGNSYVRFGAGYYGSPFGFDALGGIPLVLSSGLTSLPLSYGVLGGSVKKASMGISIPTSDNLIFDFAYELSLGSQSNMLYNYDDLLPVEQNQVKNLLMVTLRYR